AGGRAGAPADLRLLGVGAVHDDPTLQHLREAEVIAVSDSQSVQLRHVISPCWLHDWYRPALDSFPASKAAACGLDRFPEAPDPFVAAAGRYRREREPSRTLAAAVAKEGRAGSERDAAPHRRR